MFDIGWTELLLIGVVCLFVFGPEDIPKIMYNVGRVARRFRYMRYALSSQFEDFMEKAESTGKFTQKQAAANAGGKKTVASILKDEAPAHDTHEFDESDADAYLMEMLPPPENLPEIEVDIPDEPDEKPRQPATPAVDRG